MATHLCLARHTMAEFFWCSWQCAWIHCWLVVMTKKLHLGAALPKRCACVLIAWSDMVATWLIWKPGICMMLSWLQCLAIKNLLFCVFKRGLRVSNFFPSYTAWFTWQKMLWNISTTVNTTTVSKMKTTSVFLRSWPSRWQSHWWNGGSFWGGNYVCHHGSQEQGNIGKSENLRSCY